MGHTVSIDSIQQYWCVENGLLRGFVADELIVFEGLYFFHTSYPVLAVAKQPFGKTDGYEIILHPNMV